MLALAPRFERNFGKISCIFSEMRRFPHSKAEGLAKEDLTPMARVDEVLRPARTDGLWRIVALTVIGLMVVASGCGGARGRGVSDPERQSESEYDLARELFLTRNDPRSALAHAKSAIELNDENFEAQHLASLIYLYFCAVSPDECRLGEAEAHARAALKARGDYREAKNTLGVILIHREKYADAVAVLAPLTEDILYQSPWDSWGNLGFAYLMKGDVDRAIDALRRSVAAEPRYCVSHYRLGLAYEKKGELGPAEAALTRAVETDLPECKGLQDAFEARGRVRLRSDDCEGARSDWERCKELSTATPTGQRCLEELQKLSC